MKMRKDKKIHNRIVELATSLMNYKAEHEGVELADMEEELFQLRHIEDLWEKLGCITIDPETEKIEDEFFGFPVGTHREEIWHWFEATFNISVAEDMMGLWEAKE